MFDRMNVLDQLEAQAAPAGDPAKAARLREFVQKVKADPNLCWPDLATEFRKNYYDLTDMVVPIVLRMEAPMVNYQIIQSLDLSKPNEAKIVADFVQTCDAEKNQLTLTMLTSASAADIAKAATARLKTVPQPAPAPAHPG
jgi:hypothetical protein